MDDASEGAKSRSNSELRTICDDFTTNILIAGGISGLEERSGSS
jgi:hypothetical protein